MSGPLLTADVIEFIERHGRELSRRALSRQICHQFGFKTPSGRLKDMAVRKELAELVRDKKLALPQRTFPVASGAWNKVSVRLPDLESTLSQVGPVDLVLIEKLRSPLGKIWKELACHHPLGGRPLCGAQLRYLIRAKDGTWLGLLAFSSPAWALQARDRWIGWSAWARRSNLSKVVCNSRFLILPWVKIPHLASHVLGQAGQRLAQDWFKRYGVEPVLLETFVDQSHSGKSYAAANWTLVGQTQGRGRQDKEHKPFLAAKAIWMRGLKENFRELLNTPPAQAPPSSLPKKVLKSAVDWAEEEFGAAQLPDERLNKRLLYLARAFYGQPQAGIAQACNGDRAATKAAYRFFEHPEVTMDEILKPHYEATTQRTAQETTVLAVQDTTGLDYRGLEQTEGLGPTGTSGKQGLGLWLHSTVVFNLQGTPLGLIDAQCWARDAEEMGKRYRRKELPITQKESIKWLKSFEAAQRLQQACPKAVVVSVGDRESDVFELFDKARASAGVQQAHLLIRSSWNRGMENEEKLWDSVRMLSCAGELNLEVPRRGAQPKRIARMQIRFAAVKLRAPSRLARLKSVELYAIEAQEVEAPEKVTPLQWRLLTTLPVTTLEQAVEKIEWYSKRWGIEVYHRTLKSGCKIEERQLGYADRIETCLAVDVVVAWRIFHLCKLGRQTPDVACTVYFEEAQWKALVAYVTRTHPEKPPTLRQAMRMTASLGGFLGRKGDGEPGTQTLWLGLQKLDAVTDTWIAFNAMYPDRVRAAVSSNRTYG